MQAFAELVKKGYLSSVLRGKIRCFRIIGEQLLKNIRAIFGQSSEKAVDEKSAKNEETSIDTNVGKGNSCGKSSQQTVQRMFQIWQKEFPDSGEVLTKQVSAWLKAAFDEKFSKNFYEWSCYLRKVKTSSFIMERSHLQRLNWILSFETITKIQQGGYDVSEPEADPEELKRYEKELWTKLSQEIDGLSEDPICKKNIGIEYSKR